VTEAGHPAIVWPPLDELLPDWVPLAANAAPETAITAAAIRSFFMVDSKTAWTEQAQEAARLQPASRRAIPEHKDRHSIGNERFSDRNSAHCLNPIRCFIGPAIHCFEYWLAHR
jgi:hypothetical protein